jgi:hypothetical protein
MPCIASYTVIPDFRHECRSLLGRWWRQYASLKRRCTATRLHGAISEGCHLLFSSVTKLTSLNWLRGARIRRFITVFTKARHRPLSWANCIHSIPPANLPEIHSDPIYVLVFQVVSFLLAFPPKPCTLFSPMRATCPSHLILVDLMTYLTKTTI